MNRSSEVDWKTHTANRHRQGCSTSLMIRERTPRAHEIPPSPISPLTMEKFDNIKCWVECGLTEPSVPCWGGGVWNYSHFRNSEHSLVKLDIQMPHSPAIPLSGIHSRATCIHILLEMSMRMLTSMIRKQHKSGDRTNELQQESGELYCTVSIQCDNKPQLKWMNSSYI